MNEQDALLAAIRAHPDEDTPRLMYADWLDEHADTLEKPDSARARAEFIRAQIELARLPMDDAARPQLLERCEQLLYSYDAPWVREDMGERAEWLENGTLGMSFYDALSSQHVRFRRGFIDEVTIPTNCAATSHAYELLEAMPIQALHFSAQPCKRRYDPVVIDRTSFAYMPGEEESPRAARLRHLSFEYPDAVHIAGNLSVQHPHLDRLETLDVTDLVYPAEHERMLEDYRSLIDLPQLRNTVIRFRALDNADTNVRWPLPERELTEELRHYLDAHNARVEPARRARAEHYFANRHEHERFVRERSGQRALAAIEGVDMEIVTSPFDADELLHAEDLTVEQWTQYMDDETPATPPAPPAPEAPDTQTNARSWWNPRRYIGRNE